MKFAHLADTHLGYRQYGLIEREKDFYEVFEKIINKIIEEKVDFVIHSGDLFETARPSPMALLTFQKGLLKLKGAGIPVYAIAGNHDIVMRKGSIPPQVIFKKLGLKVLSNINPTYMHEDIFIAGLPYYPSSHVKSLKSKLSELSKKAANHEKSILIMHQGIDKYFGYQYELEIGDIPDNFDYYALGHIHKYVNDNFGKGKLVYPGSTEIWKTSELPDYRENGKGFVIVDFEGPKPLVNRIKIDTSREFIDKKINYNDLDGAIERIKANIKDFDKKPILNLTIDEVDSDTSGIYDVIKDELGDLALMIRPKFVMVGEKDIDIIVDEQSKLGPKELLLQQLEGYGDSEVNKLAITLYDLLSKDKIDESRIVSDEFYSENYTNVNDLVEFKTESIQKEEDSSDEDSDDSQITFNEVLK